MAIYKYTRYGTEKYGPVVIDWSLYGATGNNLPLTAKFVDFKVDPIVAEPMGYDLISLTWQSPSGTWTGLRVLKNFTGYSVNETDGEILLDVTAPDHSLIDSGVRPGAWHYYTLFVKSAGVWQRVGGSSALMVVGHGYGQRLFDNLPTYHQSSGTDANGSPIENETLKKFLNVLGWGLDSVKTNFDSLKFLNDPLRNHVSDLACLANQLGVPYEASAPSGLFRQRVGSAAVLGREKGTLEQIQSLISMTTSLDVELSLSPNRMVNDDAARFAHPVYPLYTIFLNYASGERVRFNGYVYQCKTPTNEVQTIGLGAATAGTVTITYAGQTTTAIAYTATAATVQAALQALSTIGVGNVTVTGGPWPGVLTLTFGGTLAGINVAEITATPTGLTGGTVTIATTTQGFSGGAYGQAQAPPGTQASNTWWTNLANTTDGTLVDADGAIAGWEPTHYSGAADPVLVLALGVQSFQSSTDLTANALKVSNATGLPADLGARSVAKRLGETTTDRGQVFKFGAPIPLPLPWLAADNYQRDTLVNFDGKVYRALKEVMGVAPNGGLVDDVNWEIIGLDDRVNLALSLHAKAGTGFVIPAYPVIEFFDGLGALVATVDTEKEAASGPTFDSFGSRYGTLVGRTLDTGAVAWTVQSGTWAVSDLDGGVARPLGEGLITIPGTADGNISATFDTAASTNQIQFVAFRGATATSFLLATTKALYSNLNGTYTALGTYSTPFSDKDRITVNFVGTAITVSRNGVSVLGVTSTVNQTSTLHGLGVVSTYGDLYTLLY